MTSVPINMMLDVEHRKDFGKIKAGLIEQIRMAGFTGTIGTGQLEDWTMMKDKLIDGKKL